MPGVVGDSPTHDAFAAQLGSFDRFVSASLENAGRLGRRGDRDPPCGDRIVRRGWGNRASWGDDSRFARLALMEVRDWGQSIRSLFQMESS